jgi:hypothetical protein
MDRLVTDGFVLLGGRSPTSTESCLPSRRDPSRRVVESVEPWTLRLDGRNR